MQHTIIFSTGDLEKLLFNLYYPLPPPAASSASMNDDVGGEKEPAYDERAEAAWLEKERQFQQRQLTEKALLRIREGRPTAFDIAFLATSARAGVINEDDFPFEEATFIKTPGERAALQGAIWEALEWEAQADARTYWKALLDWLKAPSGEAAGTGVEKSVWESVLKTIKGESHESLCRLEVQIRTRSRLQGDDDVDDAYWQAALGALVREKARKLATECHIKLRSQRRAETDKKLLDWRAYHEQNKEPVSIVKDEPKEEVNWDNSPRALALFERLNEVVLVGRAQRVYDIPLSEASQQSGFGRIRSSQGANGTGELLKPRYVAFVYMRIVWTRYNQVHYSSANPPPPTPQGYRFRIIYPQASGTPRYRVEPDPRGEETQFIRFMAAPYQDLLFRLPAHKWELGHRQGFVCTFQDDTLTLDFRFARVIYRR